MAGLALCASAKPVAARQAAQRPAAGQPAAAPQAAAHEEIEVKWKPVYANHAELTLNQELDLDFGDRTASEVDVQFEDWEGGVWAWAPRRGARAALAGVSDFASFDLGTIDTLGPSKERIPLVQGGSAVVAPGTIIVVVTNDNHYVKVSIDECGATLKIHWEGFEKQVSRKPPTAGPKLDAPILTSPPNEVVFDHDPRELFLTWRAVPAAASYKVEIDCKGCCAPRFDLFCSEEEDGRPFFTKTGLETPAYFVPWTGGAKQGRWRACAAAADGKCGPWSGWLTFTFRK